VGPTHHIQNTLVIGDDDAGALHLQLLPAPDLNAKAVHILESPNEPADDAEERSSSEWRSGRRGSACRPEGQAEEGAGQET
jgi:hypothetical protein